MAQKVLLIEDERELADLIELHLKDIGCEVTIAADGEDGLNAATLGSFDLILLDLMLPGLDGFEICKRIRKQSIYTPIVMITARSDELDRVLGLELGADDYLTKPFSLRELVARVKAVFRRVEALQRPRRSASLIHVGDLRIEVPTRRVTIGSREVHLTAKEFDLLAHFARRPGRVYSRAELLDRVWGLDHDGYEHTVNSHINRLRAKIEEDPAHPRYLLTVWGVGYKLAEPVP